MGVGGQHHALDYPWEGDPLPVVQEPVIRLMQLMIAGLITELFLSYHTLGYDTPLLDGWFEML
jgi:hypothetical protein